MLVIPDKMSQEKIFHLQALGAEVVHDALRRRQGPPRVLPGPGRAHRARDAGRLLRQPVRQSRQPARARDDDRPRDLASRWTARLDAVVCGVGSGGTITGLSRYFARVAPHVEMVLADPVGSILARLRADRASSAQAGSWLVEGIGEDFLPPIADLSRVKQAYTITDEESFDDRARAAARRRASSAARRPARCWPRRCATAASRRRRSASSRFVCDSGNKYLSKMYNDYWMLDQGFLRRARRSATCAT